MTERTGILEAIVAQKRALAKMAKTQRRWKRNGVIKLPEQVQVRKTVTLHQAATSYRKAIT